MRKSNTQRSIETKEKLLYSSAQIIIKNGISKLTLEEVAKNAGVSKGGLLHHFKSKEILIEEMLKFAIKKVDKNFKEFYDKEKKGKGQFLRSYIKAYLYDTNLEDIFFSKKLWSVFLSSMLENPNLIEIFKESILHNQELIDKDGIDPINVLIIRLVIDGLMINEIFHDPCSSDEMREKLINKLLDMTV